MKLLFFFLLTFLLITVVSELKAQTYADLPGPENVLVVYKQPVDDQDTLGLISEAVKDYYKTARNIPVSNILGLNSLISHNINIDGVTHPVIIAQETDNIRDSINHESGTWYATEHAWKYFYQNVAMPIKSYLTNNNLTSTIRYIVLCKGVPSKIQAGADSGSVIGNVAVDGLLCMLNTENYEDFLHSLYNKIRAQADTFPYAHKPIISNPYYDADKNWSMNYRFKPDHFNESWNGYNVKLSYLVSHLDGISFETVKNVIDRSVDADLSGDGWWVIDDDPSVRVPHDPFSDARENLILLGFGQRINWNDSDEWIVDNNGPVLGYVSWGIHAGAPYGNDSTYWVDLLNFQYANGAIATTYESFNGNSLGTLNYRAAHGLITQFTQPNLHNSA